MWVSVGVHESPEANEPNRCFNTHLLVNAQGEICERYRKVSLTSLMQLHLYDVNLQDGPSILESRTTIPGTRLVPPVPSPMGRVGVRFLHSHLATYVLRYAVSRSFSSSATSGS